MVVVEPLEKGDRLLDFLSRQARRVAIQVADQVATALADWTPVLHGQAHVPQHDLQHLGDLGVQRGGLLLDHQQHAGFGGAGDLNLLTVA